ncbi:unnamed protein product [Trichogramma brassicae]|uniref:DUF7041 domain-containing protein n=1 Tax=Trichogramma brassicae TaxID=86971 RepID=A0A6H5I329_9HYME|nr:unnamed protein product [Trichogramma brassicae]
MESGLHQIIKPAAFVITMSKGTEKKTKCRLKVTAQELSNRPLTISRLVTYFKAVFREIEEVPLPSYMTKTELNSIHDIWRKPCNVDGDPRPKRQAILSSIDIRKIAHKFSNMRLRYLEPYCVSSGFIFAVMLYHKLRSCDLPEHIPCEAFIFGTRVFSEAYLQTLEITDTDKELRRNLEAFHAGHIDAIDDFTDPKLKPDLPLDPITDAFQDEPDSIVDAEIVSELADVEARSLPKIVAAVPVERPLAAEQRAIHTVVNKDGVTVASFVITDATATAAAAQTAILRNIVKPNDVTDKYVEFTDAYRAPIDETVATDWEVDDEHDTEDGVITKVSLEESFELTDQDIENNDHVPPIPEDTDAECAAATSRGTAVHEDSEASTIQVCVNDIISHGHYFCSIIHSGTVFLSRAEERNKGRKISKGVQVNTTSRVFTFKSFLSTERATTRTACALTNFWRQEEKTFGVTVFSRPRMFQITKIAVSRSGRIRTRTPANPNPPREDPPAADGQGGGRGDGQHIPRADGAEPRQDNPLEQLIGNPLFQAMARAPAVNAVGNCRLPAFWRSDPDLWFLQVQAQFNIHQVTSDSTRFNMILTVLDPETISEVSDIIRAPPAQDKYTTLKDAIVARLTDSPDSQLHKLLGTIEVGDKKPSQLLLQMRTLAGARASNDVLRVRWLDLLPDSTRRLLTIIKNQTLDELAAVADELHAVGPSVMATEVWQPRSRPASPGGAASSISNSVVAQEIAELRAAIVQLTEITREALQRREQPRGRSRSRTQPRSQSRPRSPTPHRGSTEGYCWYHERYGDVAEQCRGSRVCSHPKVRQEN